MITALSERSKQIFRQIVDTYVETGEPIGSRTIARRPDQHLSPASIGWDGNNGMIVMTADGRTIIFGQNDNLDDKFTILRALIADGTAFTLLDLRPSTPFYRNDAPNKPAPPESTPEP